MFFTDKELDYTFVAVSEVPTLNSCAITAVRLVDEPLRCKDYIYIVQYPNGGDRKESSADVIEITDCGRFVHYACDTEYGSSGSPVFKGNRVLALHHQRVPSKKCNRGVVMIAILADLQGKRAAYKADMDVLAEAKRKAVRRAKCKAAAEVEARRLAEKETAAKFAADVAEYKRKAGRKRVAEAQRKVAAEVEARRIAEEEAAAKPILFKLLQFLFFLVLFGLAFRLAWESPDVAVVTLFQLGLLFVVVRIIVMILRHESAK